MEFYGRYISRRVTGQLSFYSFCKMELDPAFANAIQGNVTADQDFVANVSWSLVVVEPPFSTLAL